MTTRELNREELYERVWTTPMRTLALQCGVSDVALAKTCHRIGIPTPPRGYWAQLAAGKGMVERPPLPPPTHEQERFRIRLGPPRPAPPPVERPVVRIASNLRGCHEAVRELGLALADTPVDAHGRLVIESADGTLFSVTPEHHKRALLLLDAFARAVGERGHLVAFVRDERKPSSGSLVVRAGEHDIRISVTENLDSFEHKLTDKEKENVARGYTHGIPKYDYAPAGRLRLSLSNAAVARTSWSDTETRRLDSQLPSAILGMEAEVERRRAVATEAERRRREREEREAREEEERRRAREREARARHIARLETGLREMTERWITASHIRAFIAATEVALATDERRELVAEWLAFARDYACRLDPVTDATSIPQPVHPPPT